MLTSTKNIVTESVCCVLACCLKCRLKQHFEERNITLKFLRDVKTNKETKKNTYIFICVHI